jgi:hypothetical protein
MVHIPMPQHIWPPRPVLHQIQPYEVMVPLPKPAGIWQVKLVDVRGLAALLTTVEFATE